jgi:hypothetical protein
LRENKLKFFFRGNIIKSKSFRKIPLGGGESTQIAELL